MILRAARESDADAFIAIKRRLPMPAGLATTAGGFLLGTDAPTYRGYIREAHCLVAEDAGNVKGFGILFGDALIKSSDIWQRRASAGWEIDIDSYARKDLCYFEQLAFLPGCRRSVLALAFQLLKRAFDDGCEALFTTTVRSPVINLAAVPLITAAGGRLAGNIQEHYPGIGQISSDIYLIEAAMFYRQVPRLRVYDYLRHTCIAS